MLHAKQTRMGFSDLKAGLKPTSFLTSFIGAMNETRLFCLRVNLLFNLEEPTVPDARGSADYGSNITLDDFVAAVIYGEHASSFDLTLVLDFS